MGRPKRNARLPEKLRLDFYIPNDRGVNNEQEGEGRNSAAGDGAQNGEFTEDDDTAAQYAVEGVEVDEFASDDEIAAQYADEGVESDNITSEDDGTAEEVPATGLGPGEMPAQNAAAERVKWGDLLGLDDITIFIEDIYATITTWRANMFEVPRSLAGKDFIAEATRLLRLFNTQTRWEPLAINILLIFFPMMLQMVDHSIRSVRRTLLKRDIHCIQTKNTK